MSYKIPFLQSLITTVIFLFLYFYKGLEVAITFVVVILILVLLYYQSKRLKQYGESL